MAHDRKSFGRLLRLGGVALLALAYVAGRALRGYAVAGQVDQAAAYLLAAILFVCASGGTVLLVLGPHLLDRVRIAQRWRRTDD